MLYVTLPATDDLPAVELQLEHSLASLSKWESKHEKAFFGHETKTEEQMSDYLVHMIIGEKPPEKFIERLDKNEVERIGAYINSKQSATWFNEDPNAKGPREVVTSELIYYWMISFQIPFDCDTWHLNRLMTLVRICGLKQAKPKKMSRTALAEQNRALNAQRRQQLGTTG